MGADANEALTQQGDRMRKYVQDRAHTKMKPPIQVGAVVQIKVDKVDSGNLDH
jgi:hypothetical protein